VGKETPHDQHNSRWGSFLTPTYRVELQTDNAILAVGRDGRHVFFTVNLAERGRRLLVDHTCIGFPTRYIAKAAVNLALCLDSITKMTSAHRRSSTFTGCRAFGLVPPDRTATRGSLRHSCSAVGLRHWLRLHTNKACKGLRGFFIELHECGFGNQRASGARHTRIDKDHFTFVNFAGGHKAEPQVKRPRAARRRYIGRV
jgi:hypothetical protein